MQNSYVLVKKSPPLKGTAQLVGAKNSVLSIMSSVILTQGVSFLRNVPNITDVEIMIKILESLGCNIIFDKIKHELEIDTSKLCNTQIKQEYMTQIRHSILIIGPLLSRFGKAQVYYPGGCDFGNRSISYHLESFKKMGAIVETHGSSITLQMKEKQSHQQIITIKLKSPSVGTTLNILMFASLMNGNTKIINAAVDPEIQDLIDILTKMGANITIFYDKLQNKNHEFKQNVIEIVGVYKLEPVIHSIIPDRLEASTIILSAAITGGEVTIPQARPDHMEYFLSKLKEMGHQIYTGINPTKQFPNQGIRFIANVQSIPVNIVTGPHPDFLSTDLQPLLTSVLCLISGKSYIQEYVFDNRFQHVEPLQKMGANIMIKNLNEATIQGVDRLIGKRVIASNIRCFSALILAGLAAENQTEIYGVQHLFRGHENLPEVLKILGAHIEIIENNQIQEFKAKL